MGPGSMQQFGDGILEDRVDRTPASLNLLKNKPGCQQLGAVCGNRQLVEQGAVDRCRCAPEHGIGEGIADDANLAAALPRGEIPELVVHFPLRQVKVGNESPLPIGRDGNARGGLDVLEESRPLNRLDHHRRLEENV